MPTRLLMTFAPGAYGAGPLGPARCSTGYPSRDARSCAAALVEERLGELEIVGERELQVAPLPRDDHDLAPGGFDQCCVVCVDPAPRVRVAECRRAKRLRRLDR